MPEVVIVGAGVAGLACAHHLHAAGVEVLVLEASDAVGGHLRTDVVDGFRLDRGFHVLLTAAPEARRLLDYDALALHAFEPGAMVRRDGPLPAGVRSLAPAAGRARELRPRQPGGPASAPCACARG
jgi:phytoene dehydrogenase-like protein